MRTTKEERAMWRAGKADPSEDDVLRLIDDAEYAESIEQKQNRRGLGWVCPKCLEKVSKNDG